MEMFVWRDEFSVGDETIDRQHRELIRLMNDLYELICQPVQEQGEGQIDYLFGGLAEYIYTHFAYEEKRMADAGYPANRLAAHREEHNAIVRRIREFHAQVNEGEHEALKDMLPYLYGDWLIHHILESDMAYRPFLQKQAGG